MKQFLPLCIYSNLKVNSVLAYAFGSPQDNLSIVRALDLSTKCYSPEQSIL